MAPQESTKNRGSKHTQRSTMAFSTLHHRYSQATISGDFSSISTEISAGLVEWIVMGTVCQRFFFLYLGYNMQLKELAHPSLTLKGTGELVFLEGAHVIAWDLGLERGKWSTSARRVYEWKCTTVSKRAILSSPCSSLIDSNSVCVTNRKYQPVSGNAMQMHEGTPFQ